MGDAFWGLQDAQKGGAVDRVSAKGRVHHPTGVVERTQGACRQPFDADGGLVEPEGFQNRMRLAQVQVVAGDFEHAGFVSKVRVDRVQDLGCRIETFFNVEQQNLVQLCHGFGGPVVALHQRFTGSTGIQTAVILPAQTHLLAHCMLQVKHQAVFPTLGGQMQTGANQRQGVLVARDLLGLKGRGQTAARQVMPTATKACSPGNPQNHLQITQTARRLFAVGLQRVRRVLKLGVTLVELECFGGEKSLRVHRCIKALLEGIEQSHAACDPSRFQ